MPYGEFMRVMNILRADGFLKVGLVGLDENVEEAAALTSGGS